MLAFKNRPDKLSYPVFIQPKFNGVRALYLPKQQTLQSRDELLWDPEVVKHLLTQLTRLNFMLDGELYKHGMSLQQINSRIAVNRIRPHDKASEVGYMIFDIPLMKPMWERVRMLEQLRVWLEKEFPGQTLLQVTETHLVYSQLEADYYYKQWKDQGFEGLMYRDYNAPYGFLPNCTNKENRWWYIQKRKDFLDLEATIVGVYESNTIAGDPKGILGGFHCITDEGLEFDVGGGLDMDQRVRYWEHPEFIIGKRLRINYEMFSDGGNPLKATIECVYE